MRYDTLLALSFASSAVLHADNVNVTSIYMETYWRAGDSGGADIVQSVTSAGSYQLINNGLVGAHEIGPGEIYASGSALPGHTGYWRQYAWIQMQVSADTQIRFYGNLAAPVVQQDDYQYAYIADATNGFTNLYGAGGLPLNLTTPGPLFYETYLTLSAGTSYAFEMSTSWISTSAAAATPITTFGISYIPVPEPSTYGLALGGLALVGAVIRRRKTSK